MMLKMSNIEWNYNIFVDSNLPEIHKVFHTFRFFGLHTYPDHVLIRGVTRF